MLCSLILTILWDRKLLVGGGGHQMHCPYCLIQNIVMYNITFQHAVVHFSNQFSKILHFLERENEQVPAKICQKAPFLTVYTRWLQ